MLARREVTVEQCLDELRDELAEVGMEPVDVLRPLALGQLGLRPGEVEVEVAVEGVLCRGHGSAEFGAAEGVLVQDAFGDPLDAPSARTASELERQPRGRELGSEASHASIPRRRRRCFRRRPPRSGRRTPALLQLDLAEDQAPAPAHDEVELDAAGADVASRIR